MSPIGVANSRMSTDYAQKSPDHKGGHKRLWIQPQHNHIIVGRRDMLVAFCQIRYQDEGGY
jgi:hypothetical protein